MAPVPATPLLTGFRALCEKILQGRDEERAFQTEQGTPVGQQAVDIAAESVEVRFLLH